MALIRVYAKSTDDAKAIARSVCACKREVYAGVWWVEDGKRRELLWSEL